MRFGRPTITFSLPICISCLAQISQELFILHFLSFQVGPLLVNYSSKNGIYGDPKTNIFVTITVTEIEKSDQMKAFILTDVNLDIQSSRKYIFL